MGTNIYPGAAGGTQSVLDAIRRIVHALRESSRLAEKHVGLSGAQLFVLQQLGRVRSLSVNELAAQTHTHQSSVSAVVSRLVARGLVTRARSSRDGRSVELSLAPAGRRIVARAPDLAQARLVAAIESVPPARRRQLASTLGELARAVDAADRVPAMFFEDRSRAGRKRGVARA